MTKRLGCLICMLHSIVYGQSIEGRVVDAFNGEILTGVVITIDESEHGAVSDDEGYYNIGKLTAGRYTVRANFIGYKVAQFVDVWVKNGHIFNLNIELHPYPLTLDQVVIETQNLLIAPGRRNINEEQISRFASSYLDPARLILTAPDLAVTNDQNNQISVRGISPDYNIWRLEGVEIANPNHLSNAGTLTDQPAGSSGGVNMLSAQMLAESSFMYGAMNNSLGNSVGGIFDMYLKEGISSDYQFITQASLIGLDFSAQGPLRKESKATFITNYRYSFTGLLSLMGVDFGGETIGFQDLSFNLFFPLKKGGQLKIFGVGGTSFNNFEHKKYEDSEEEKDRSDIYYYGQTGFIGASYRKGGLSASIVSSGFKNDRKETNYDDNDLVVQKEIVEKDKSVVGSNINYRKQLGVGVFRIGTNNNLYSYNLVKTKQLLSQYFVSMNWYLGSKINLYSGISSQVSFDDYSIDPRVALTLITTKNSLVTISAGLYSQQLNPYNNYFAQYAGSGYYYISNKYDFIQSSRYTLSYEWQSSGYAISSEIFYYHFEDIDALVEDFTNSYQGNTYGMTTTFSKNYNEDWYWLLGGSIFNSTLNQGRLDNPFNSKYNTSAALGREFDLNKKELIRKFSINTRLTWQGGMYYANPDLTFQQYTLQNSDLLRLDDYLRFDIRLQWTKQKEFSNQLWSIDIQNLLNRGNQGFVYYDRFLMQKRYFKQLGLIPVLTYRLEF